MAAGLLGSVPLAWVRTPREPLASNALTLICTLPALPVSLGCPGRERSCRSFSLVMGAVKSSSSLPL